MSEQVETYVRSTFGNLTKEQRKILIDEIKMLIERLKTLRKQARR